MTMVIMAMDMVDMVMAIMTMVMATMGVMDMVAVVSRHIMCFPTYPCPLKTMLQPASSGVTTRCATVHITITHSRLCWQWGTEARIKSVRLELSLEGWEAASSLYFTVTSYKIGRQGGECEPSRSVCA